MCLSGLPRASHLTLRSLVALVASLLAACSGMQLDIRDTRLNTLSPTYLLEHLAFYPQVEDQCGPSSLATMLAAQGIQTSPAKLRDKLYIPGKKGSITTEMVARARRFGLMVYPLENDVIDILLEIHAGNPVLVMQNLGYNWMPKWHFSVALGYDLSNQTLILQSGDKRFYEVSFSLFHKTWQRADYWAVVILQSNKLAQTASVGVAMSAANQLEQVAEYGAALNAYQAMLDKWPDHNMARFGAGNAAFALGEFGRAVGYFSEFLLHQPKASFVWNNLAYSLAKQGCKTAAQASIHCAIELDPKNANLQESATELELLSSNASKTRCPQVLCPLD